MELSVLKKMLIGGAKKILDNKQELNDMNVFPIPDGDTGTNMDKTMSGVLQGLAEIGDRDLESSDFDKLYTGALMNSQGNSGVILSQWLKGFLKAFKDFDEVNAGTLYAGFLAGTESAYNSVAEPVEGTFLTVCREAQENAEDNLDEDTTTEQFMKDIVDGAAESLKHTPELLPVLKEYNVLDSGAMGFVCLVTGMLEALDESFSIDLSEFESVATATSGAATVPGMGEGLAEFGYCTEMIIQLDDDKADSFNETLVTSDMRDFGNSLVLVRDGNQVKIHIHTLKPESVMAYYHRYGEFIKLKIENMTIQHNETVFAAGKKDVAIVAVADGDGFEKLFKDMGVAEIARGGQSNNVSVLSLCDTCNNAGAKKIIILPNNKNIIMTAEKVREVMKDCEIHIVPTRSMAEGYLALSLIDANASCEEIEVAMNKALEGVHTGLIAKSDKRGTYNGVYVDVGDYIGVLDDDIITCASPDLKECFSSFISKVPDADIFESVLIFADNDEDKALADGMNDGIKANFPSAEIFSCLGGQNIYNYVIAFS
ncbi:MAG: DAK2 domain-containing protein [Clostridiales bacterium]|nr:DAK2 domain-containing protein [Clostridiales bacterium]